MSRPGRSHQHSLDKRCGPLFSASPGTKSEPNGRAGFASTKDVTPSKPSGPALKVDRLLSVKACIWTLNPQPTPLTQAHRFPFWLVCLKTRGPWFRWGYSIYQGHLFFQKFTYAQAMLVPFPHFPQENDKLQPGGEEALCQRFPLCASRCGCGCQNRFGIPVLGIGEFTTHFRAYFSGDWDVHWGYGVWSHGHIVQVAIVFAELFAYHWGVFFGGKWRRLPAQVMIWG